MHGDGELLSALDGFVEDGWITEVVRQVKSGKEATVFCCLAGPRAADGLELARGSDALVAAKVHRPLEKRSFRNDAMYQGGRVTMAHDSRFRRALLNKSSFGRQVQYGSWLYQEWELLARLHEAGVAVPRPLAIGERALLMSFIGDSNDAAPMLHDTRLEPADVEHVVDHLLASIEHMLDLHVVHGDLSPYNVLYWQDQPVIIDLPQAVDPRLNAGAASLLSRDIENITRWAARRGVNRPAQRIFVDLWSRFVEGALG